MPSPPNFPSAEMKTTVAGPIRPEPDPEPDPRN